MSVVRLDKITKTYEETGVKAVDSVSLNVEQGEVLTLLGPSGCGKTTILRLIAGFERPDQGKITVANKVVASSNKWIAPEDRGVGMVFQDYALFPHLNVAKNVAFGLWRLDKDEKTKRVKEALEVVGLSKYINHYPHELSGGQQQRLALARSLAGRPQVILLDEPLSNLDADLRKQMRNELKQILEKAGATAILVTHDQEDCFALATSVAILKQGSLEQTGRSEDLYHEPETRFVANFLGQADFLPAYIDKQTIVSPIETFKNNEDIADGTAVDILIRPDDVTLSPHSRGKGIIKACQFKGAEMLYTVEVGDITLHSLGASYGGHSAGTRVDIRVAVDHLVVFEKNKERRSGRKLKKGKSGSLELRAPAN